MQQQKPTWKVTGISGKRKHCTYIHMPMYVRGGEYEEVVSDVSRVLERHTVILVCKSGRSVPY